MDWIAALRLAGWSYVVYLVCDAMRYDAIFVSLCTSRRRERYPRTIVKRDGRTWGGRRGET